MINQRIHFEEGGYFTFPSYYEYSVIPISIFANEISMCAKIIFSKTAFNCGKTLLHYSLWWLVLSQPYALLGCGPFFPTCIVGT